MNNLLNVDRDRSPPSLLNENNASLQNVQMITGRLGRGRSSGPPPPSAVFRHPVLQPGSPNVSTESQTLPELYQEENDETSKDQAKDFINDTPQKAKGSMLLFKNFYPRKGKDTREKQVKNAKSLGVQYGSISKKPEINTENQELKLIQVEKKDSPSTLTDPDESNSKSQKEINKKDSPLTLTDPDESNTKSQNEVEKKDSPSTLPDPENTSNSKSQKEVEKKDSPLTLPDPANKSSSKSQKSEGEPPTETNIEREQDHLFSTVSKIGQGSYGKVFHVRDELKNEYAMKVMNEETGNKNQIENEIQILKLLRELKCRNFNCAEMIKYYQMGMCTYFLFPLYGPPVSKRISIRDEYGNVLVRGFQIEQVEQILSQLFLALNFLHFNKIAHMDIKTDNIIFTQGNWVEEKDKITGIRCVKMLSTEIRLIDFGLSLVKPGIPQVPNRNKTVCCALYLPPETILKTSISFPVDIWCSGLVGIAMFLGRELFFGTSKSERLVQMEIVLGPFPKRLLELKKSKKYFRNGVTKTHPKIRDDLLQRLLPLKKLKKGMPSDKTDKLFDLFEQMLKLDSRERPKSGQLMNMI